MSARQYILTAATGSAVLLGAAFLFQTLGWAPCKMCLWQRWPHVAAIGVGIACLALGPSRALALLGGLAALTTAGIAAFHSGVERKWWDGPASCSGTGSSLESLSAADLVPGASDAPALVLCDTLTPFLFGLTMANWNMIASLLLAALWVAAFRRVS